MTHRDDSAGGTRSTGATVLKVGDVAARTGVSVRTLHYYEELGLLAPAHSAAGHRQYRAADLERLQRIRSLRQLGFSLDEIRACLADRRFSARRVVELHRQRVRDQMVALQQLGARLDAVAARLASRDHPSLDDLLSTIEAITMADTQFTPDEMAEIQERGGTLGPDHIREVEAEWPTLIAKVKAEMDKGTDPTHERVRALAERWGQLVREFTGGNAAIEQKMRARGAEMHKAWAEHGSPITPAMMQYIAKSRATS